MGIFAQETAPPSLLKNQTDSISYALGMDIGKSLGQLELPLNADLLYHGLADAMKGNDSAFTEAQTRALLASFQQQAKEAQVKKQQEIADKAKIEGELFLQENQEKEGVVTTESGLQYKIITPGTGAIPTAAQTVKVHYEGKLLNETIFDSSFERGEPLDLGVSQVITGWTEALQLMKVGAKWELYIPYNLAYGERGAPPGIGPFQTLIFTVELLGIQQE